MYTSTIQKLIKEFSKFPTVGPRTAARFVFYLLNLPKEEVLNLLKSIQELKAQVRLCSFCFNPYEGREPLCAICQNATRDRSLLCVVEKEVDLDSIEKTKKYKGLYFILGGTVSTLKKEDIEKLRIEELKERILSPKKSGLGADFKEIIIAVNPTTEGEATALYLERHLKTLKSGGELAEPIKITRLGRGLPVGGELEYADEETLSSALESRR